MKDQNSGNNSDSNNRPAPVDPIEWMRWIPAALLAIVFLVLIFVSGRIVLVPMLISVALAYLLAPVVTWFERHGWSRSSSTLMGITAATLMIVLVLIFVIPSVWNQLNQTYGQAKTLWDDKARTEALVLKIKQINPQLSTLIEKQLADYSIEPDNILSWLGKWLQTGLFKLVDLTSSILDFLLIPFFVFYLLADYREMSERIDRLIPPRFRTVTTGLIGQINNVLSSYVRSQLLIAVTMGAMYSAGFLILRVPLGFTLGMLSGLFNFVPYLGTLIGLALSLFFVALDGAGFGRISGVLIVFAVVQSVEGYYLTPKLLGSRLNLHPMWVLVGLVIGGNLFGLLGIILAVPVIAVAKVVLGALEDIYQDSSFYRRTGSTLLTGQGQIVGLSESGSPTTGLIVQEEISDRPRRTIITTSELRSRIRDGKPNSED